MAKMNTNASDQSKSLDDHMAEVMSSMVVTTQPVMVTGVQRKVNIGNFETIDIYCAVALPVVVADQLNMQELVDKLGEVAQVGFHITSSETLSRYKVVKDSL